MREREREQRKLVHVHGVIQNNKHYMIIIPVYVAVQMSCSLVFNSRKWIEKIVNLQQSGHDRLSHSLYGYHF